MSILKEYLKKIGVDAKTIAAIEKAETDKTDLDLGPLVDEYKGSQKKLFENDPDLVSSIASSEQGKLLDIWTRKMKTKFNLSSDLVKDKKFEEIIDIAKAESTKGLDKNLQTLQEEVVAANAKVKEFEEVIIPKIKDEVQIEKKQFVIGNHLKKLIPHADLRVSEDIVELALQTKLHSAYDLDLDDEGNLQVFLKGKRVSPQSADKTKLLTVNDIVSDILKQGKLIKESNADDIDPNTGKPKVVKPDPAGGEKKIDDEKMKTIAPHLAAAQKHKETIAAAKQNAQ